MKQELASVEFVIPAAWSLDKVFELNDFLSDNVGVRHNWIGSSTKYPHGRFMLYESDRPFFTMLKLKYGIEEKWEMIIEIPRSLPLAKRMEISNWVGANKPEATWFDGGGRVIIRDEELAIVFKLMFGL